MYLNHFLSIFLVSLFLLGIHLSATAQKILQMETAGTLKTQKYFIGDQVTFQLKGTDYWTRENIRDILIEDNMVVFTNRAVNIDDIAKIRTYKNRAWSKGLSQKALFFAGSFVSFSLLGTLVGWSLRPATIIIPGVAIAVTWTLRIIFRRRTFKIGKRRRLRVLDLTFYGVGP